MNAVDTRKVYFSKKLNKALDKILGSQCTVVNAPFGFGKTRSVKGYFDKNEIPYVWIDCVSAPEVFWGKYCDAVAKLDKEAAAIARSIGY
ncbi:MAG: hypothetical protein ACI4EV_07445, partial [Lachnospiraceae bacterium]